MLFEWKEPFTHITACEYPEGSSDYAVLPEWYYTSSPESDLNEQPASGEPPSGEASSSSGKQGSAKCERET